MNWVLYLRQFVVIFKITKKYVVIGDPAKDLMRMEIDEFYKSFTGVMVILKPNDSFVKGKIKGEKIFDRYLKLLWPQKKLFFYGILASFLITLLGIISSVFNNIIYDEILPYKQEDTLRMVLLVFLGVSFVKISIGFIRQWIMMHLSIRIDIPLMQFSQKNNVENGHDSRYWLAFNAIYATPITGLS